MLISVFNGFCNTLVFVNHNKKSESYNTMGTGAGNVYVWVRGRVGFCDCGSVTMVYATVFHTLLDDVPDEIG